jgi:hypothetical protein
MLYHVNIAYITYNEETFVFNLFKKLKSHMYFRLKEKEIS